MLLLKGFVLPTNHMDGVLEAVSKLKTLVENRGKNLYYKLLASELERVVDDVATNAMQAPSISLYQFAVGLLDQRIDSAIRSNAPLPYNLSVRLSVFNYKGNVYLRLDGRNEALINPIKHFGAVEDYSVYDDEDKKAAPNNAKRRAKWEEMMKEGTQPLFVQIFPSDPIRPEWKFLQKHFHTREERAATRAMYQEMSALLNLLGMGREIPPHMLMPLINESIGLLDTNQTIVEDLKALQSQILPILPNITEEYVKMTPGEVAVENSEEAEVIDERSPACADASSVSPKSIPAGGDESSKAAASENNMEHDPGEATPVE